MKLIVFLLFLIFNQSRHEAYHFPIRFISKTLKLSSVINDINGLAESRSLLRPQLLENVEVDYLGMINFCLEEGDNALSSPSRTKLLNKITNEVFKVFIIGNIQLKRKLYEQFDNYKVSLSDIETCFPENSKDNEVYMEQCLIQSKKDLALAIDYLNRLQVLIGEGRILESIAFESISLCYARGFDRLIDALKEGGCMIQGNTIEKHLDKNICLSLLDMRSTKESKTKELNSISNSVSMAMLYGTKEDKNALADVILTRIPDFSKQWLAGDMNRQEIRFLKSLVLLLEVGISKAEDAVTFDPYQKSQITLSSDNISPVQMMGMTRKIVVDGCCNDESVDSESSSLRLYDVYLNAFQRVIEVSLSEISNRLSSNSLPYNEDFLLNFVQWEQSIRRNLTSELWLPNPKELVGTWQFVDIKGAGGLQSLLLQSDEYLDNTNSYNESIGENQSDNLLYSDSLSVEFQESGEVALKAGSRSSALGQNWFFKPGPAHLDTCEFFVKSKIDNDLLLKYVGFIDRGQRIESRFSKSPIRMTGRVLTLKKNELIGSCRFIMVLKRD